MYSFNF